MLGQESANPIRLTASYTFGLETLNRIEGYEEALRVDMESVLADKRDKLVINGQAAVTDVSPAVDGVINSLMDPTNPTDVAAWNDYLDSFDDMVDGLHANTAEEVRFLVNVDTWKHANGLQVATSGALLRDILPSERFRSSANMPSTTSTIATAIGYRAGSPARGMFMPTWAGVEFIVDPYTLAKKGQKILTAVMIVGFEMVDSSAYARVEFKVA